ncbi:MAG: hypothetical protein DRO40_03080 [Thermoprotei archaeon]|nr:MAG: hypothetical protein DRO40_03080 [Thermoprotei archaeon]
MVYKSGIKRVKGGKTLKIDLDVESGIIKDIIISGDFFAYPMEAVDELENMLKGASVSNAIEIINCFRDRIVFIGLTIDDIIDLLRKILFL